jgi:RNA polymerase sigma factor (sigma-70 family)
MTEASVEIPDEVWAAVLAQRERAIRVARARCSRRQEVDDLVQEALLRVASMPDLELANIGPLVTVVVSNLIIDGHRGRLRSAKTAARLRGTRHEVTAHDDDVCDRYEARWLRSRMSTLGNQDRRALELRAEGLALGEIATVLGISYKAAERALARARNSMRTIWRSGAALVGILTAVIGRRLNSRGPRVGVLVLASALVTMMLATPWTGATRDAHPGGSVTAAASTEPDGMRPPRRVAPAAAGMATASVSARRPHAADVTRLAAVPAVGSRPLLRYEGGKLERKHPDETFVQTVQRCLRKGVTVTVHYVGCNE